MDFPTSLDTFTNPVSTEYLGNAAGVGVASIFSSLNDAVEALEAKVGANSSAVTTSHDYKLSGITGSDKAVSKTGTETLTNKTFTTPVINNPTINVDTISEFTGANGVTVDGLNMKDGKLNTNNSVVTTNITNDNITFIKLLTTIFSGQLQSQANAGTAGGTIYYVNLGGIKMAWGLTGSLTASGAAPASSSYGITLPTDFFSTIQHAHISATPGTASNSQYIYCAPNSACTTTSWNFYISSSTGTNGTTSKAGFLIIGS